jgi:hypothetical protein
MRQLWIALFCVAFAMSGSLMTTAHTMAHAQSVVSVEVDVADDHHHDNQAHNDDHQDGDPAEHHKHTGHTGDHGAELHFTALGASPLASELTSPVDMLKSVYRESQYPAPLLPPDPDPDRV